MKKSIRSFILFISVIIFGVASLVAFAGAYPIEGVFEDGYYTYEYEDWKATIIEVDDSISGDITIPDYIVLEPVVREYPVREIGEYAFGFCDEITSVTIPEELDYNELFDDLFEKYTTSAVLIKVKLKNLGTLFQLTYDITLKDVKIEKQFIDEIRVRNANLDILCSRVITGSDEL